LAVRYQGQIGELGALAQIVQCYSWIGQTDKATAALGRLNSAYDKIPDSVFVGGDPKYERKYWLDWIAETKKRLADPPKASTTP
jgi:hypothetical protein